MYSNAVLVFHCCHNKFKIIRMYCLAILYIGQKFGVYLTGLKPGVGRVFFLEALGENLFAHSGCWQSSVLCSYRIEDCMSLLAVS